MNEIEEVILSYGVKPTSVTKISERLHKIEDGYHQYALKKSRLTRDRTVMWERVFHDAHQQQLTAISPLYLTTRNSLYTNHNQNYYYLTPWLTGRQATIEQLYQAIGKIHKQTMKTEEVDHQQMTDHFQQYQQYCNELQGRNFAFVQQFESRVYMSPLELQVCTHYRDIELVFKKIREQINRFTDKQAEEESFMWSYSLCHGNLQLAHTLEADHTYILNWEQAKYQDPIMDLVIFFKNEIVEYDAPIETIIDSFTSYMKENELNNYELSLLLIHLLDPTNYLNVVQQYIDQTGNQSIINQIKQLEILYRQLIFGLQLVNYIDENYFSIILEDLDS